MTAHTCTTHQPGSASCVRYHDCPCRPCRDASNRAHKLRRWRSDMVPAEPIRAHIAALRAAGYPDHTIATTAGRSLHLLRYTMTTAKSVHRATAAAFLSVKAGAVDGMVAAHGTHRRIQALCTLGYPLSTQARLLQRPQGSVSHYLRVPKVTTSTARAVAGLYDELWDKPAQPGQGATRARKLARLNGWPPPLAWDEGTGPHGIDNPDATPHTPRSERANSRAVTLDEAEWLLDAGEAPAQVAAKLGVRLDTLRKGALGMGRATLAERLVPPDPLRDGTNQYTRREAAA